MNECVLIQIGWLLWDLNPALASQRLKRIISYAVSEHVPIHEDDEMPISFWDMNDDERHNFVLKSVAPHFCNCGKYPLCEALITQ